MVSALQIHTVLYLIEWDYGPLPLNWVYLYIFRTSLWTHCVIPCCNRTSLIFFLRWVYCKAQYLLPIFSIGQWTRCVAHCIMHKKKIIQLNASIWFYLSLTNCWKPRVSFILQETYILLVRTYREQSTLRVAIPRNAI